MTCRLCVESAARPGLFGARSRAFVMAIGLLAAVAQLSGCAAVAFPVAVIAGENKTVIAEAEYKGLDGQRVAVLVDAHDMIMAEHPLAQLEVSTAISRAIVDRVPVGSIVDPRQVVEFQNNNIYWNTMPYSRLAERLNVTRLVLIDLADYRLHEPGNVALWRGTVTGQVSVVEADGPRPDDRVYATQIAAQYPDTPIGAVRSNEQAIRKGMLDVFALNISTRFYDFKTEVPR